MCLDEIPPLFLKDTAYVISKPLAHIINCPLMSGVVPNDFKRARVVPVYHDNFDSYRPISVLPAISKILGKCVHSHLIQQLENNNQNQFAFCKYRSTELAAVWLTDQIHGSIDTGILTGAIYVDMSKAFDTVGHAGIINKLPDYGIAGMPQEWIIHYLFNRFQQVTFQNSLYRPEPTVCGVPQGSILGPLLFVLYIDDITTSLHQAKIVKYADDTVIFYSNKDAEVIQTVLNNELSSMTNWFRNNELIINTKRGKTEVTLFGTSKRLCKLNNPPLKIVNNFETINYKKSYKYLGLILDETLNMSEHMKATMKKSRSRVNLLRRIKPLTEAYTASLIFKVMILPISTYCPYSTFKNIPN